MDQENIKAERPSTPQNPKIKEEALGPASTWGSKEIERFKIKFDQKTYLDLHDVIHKKWFDFSRSTKLDLEGT